MINRCVHIESEECTCACHIQPILHDKACCVACPRCGFLVKEGLYPLYPLYQVQLEFANHTYSYEVATPDFDAVEIAKAHLKESIGKPLILPVPVVAVGGYSQIGEHPYKGVISWERKR